MQDLYLNSFTRYAFVVFVSCLPTTLFLFLGEHPKNQIFLGHTFYDFALTGASALGDLTMQAIVFYIFPEPMRYSQQYFKTLGAPVAFSFFVFWFAAQFKKS